MFGARKHTERSVEKILNDICLQAQRMYRDADFSFYASETEGDGVRGTVVINSVGSFNESAIAGLLEKNLRNAGATDVHSLGKNTVPRVSGTFA